MTVLSILHTIFNLNAVYYYIMQYIQLYKGLGIDILFISLN